MGERYLLERTQLVHRPRSEVFAFFSNAGNLEALTPRSLKFQILTPQPIVMAAGAVIDYRIKLFGVPFNWRTEIVEFEPERRFVDVQLRGPYRYWRHEHTFREATGGTLMSDRVEYELPWGPLGRVAQALFVRRNLDSIFAYRHERVEQLLGD